MQTNNLIETDRRIELEYELRRRSEKERCEQSFEQFVKSAWHILEPATPLLWSPHLTFLCDTVQRELVRIAKRQKRKKHLCINVPPSSLKSMILTRMANAWAWIHWPWMRFITASHTQSLAEEHALDTKTIITSEWYQNYWNDKFFIISEQKAKSFFRTNMRGQRQVTSVTSTTLGRHCHVFICDDLLDPKKAISEADLSAADMFWRRTAQSRFVNSQIGMFWVIQQRLSPFDTTGMILEREREDFEIICLPGEYREWVEPKAAREFYITVDHRRPPILMPEKYPWSELDNMKKKLGDVAYAAQFLQRPSPEEGDIFKQKNWRFWLPAGVTLPPVKVMVGTDTFTCENVTLPKSFDDSVCSWDFAFKDKETSDPVSGDVVAESGANFYILWEDYGRKDYSKSCASMIKMRNDWPRTSQILIEGKANGPAIISSYKELISGIVDISANKNDSPKTKALIVSKKHETGNLIAPHPDLPGYEWVRPMIQEFSDYTGAETDRNDRIAAICQAVCHMSHLKPVFEYYQQKQYDIKIDWKDLKPEMRLYISVWTEEDLNTSTVMGAWNSRTGKMAIINEFISSTPDPQIIELFFKISIGRITGASITDLERFTWIGSPLMFGYQTNKSSRMNTRSTIMREGIVESYRRIGINLVENSFFEENGAITTTDRMFKEDSILVDNRAPETARQPAAWCYDGKSPAAGHGCARALINLCSAVYEAGRSAAPDTRIPEYNPLREAINKELNREIDPDITGRYIKERPVVPTVPEDDKSGVSPNERWMV